MRQDLQELIGKLKQDEFTALSVFSSTKFLVVSSPRTHKNFVEKYGSFENFLEKVKKDGHDEIIIQEYRKNGSSYKKIGNPLPLLTFSDKVVTSNGKATHNENMNGLQGTGLGFADLMALNTDSVLKARLEVENEFLKKNNTFLTDEVAKLKEEILSSKYDLSKNSGRNELLISAIPTIENVLKGLLGGNSPLNGAAQKNNAPLSGYKEELQSLLNSNDFTDAYANYLLEIIDKLKDPVFYNKLEIMLQEN
jgi:hypothetical protein